MRFLLVIPAALGVAVLVLCSRADEPESTAVANAADERHPELLAAATDLQGDTASPRLVGRVAKRDGRRGSAVVHVRAGDVPRSFARVRITGLRGSRAVHRLTDYAGNVHLKDVPLDGSVSVAATGADGIVFGRVAVEAAEQELRCERGLPMRAVFLDGVTGRAIRNVEWTPVPPREGPWQLTMDAVKETCQVLPGDGDREAGLFALARPGYVAWDDDEWRVPISRYAHELRVHYPLRREASVYVRAETHDGKPVPDAVVADFQIGGKYWGGRVETFRTRGGQYVKGVPFFRDEPLRVLVLPPADEPEAIDVEEVVETDNDLPFLEAEHGEALLVDMVDMEAYYPGAAIAGDRLPMSVDTTLELVATFPEDPFEGVVWGTNSLITFGSGDGMLHRGPLGTLEVEVRCADGRPATGAHLLLIGAGRSQRTDLSGKAVFQAPTGDYSLYLREPGLVHTKMRVRVEAGTMRRVTLRENVGATVRLKVVDSEDRPLPFAAVRVSRRRIHRWVDLEDGVQRLDPFTDVDGVRILRRLPPEEFEIHARWAARKGKAEVRLKNGQTKTVTIRVAAPKP